MKYRVAVRELTEFTAKAGDLDLRFAPAPSAQDGIAGHQVVTARRPTGYQTEVALSADYKQLSVRGRADGFDAQRARVEEIKTYRGELERMPANHRALHLAQARIYGWMLCKQLGLAQIEVALVYFEIGSQAETVFVESCSADELQAHFEQHCDRFLTWAQAELAHRAARDASLQTLRFPHPDFRAGQRELAEAVYRAARGARCLLAQAPTGIGKTVGTLFPLLRAAPEHKLDKIFFLTAKTPGRALAMGALQRLRDQGIALRVLELVARDKACEHPDKACHGESCPLAQGFYDRLPAARSAALTRMQQEPQARAALRETALEHRVCPYYLSQDLVRWADVIVGDYNYYFDGGALLHALTVANDWRIGLLVDEAHNLLERARGMYTAELDQRALQGLRRTTPVVLKKPLDKLNRCWNGLNKESEQPYRILDAAPTQFAYALQQAVAAIGSFYADFPAHVDPALQRFYFDALQFSRLLETLDLHTLVDLTRAHRHSVLGVRNVIPAPFLQPRFATAHVCVLFSATLSPWHFHADTLGLPADSAWVDVPSPFSAEQLDVRIVRGISTRYRDRSASRARVADLIGQQYRARPGNYLAFFSSFDYLQQVAEACAAAFPEIAQWQQARGMGEAERDAFLARFVAGGSGIGFAVLGGAFAEGIDLEGERLIGAFVATLGLPQLNAFNEEVRARMDAAFGDGHDYAYLYPGLRKVVQAAGRVIRTPQDRGVVVLIDDRYARAEVRRLLPSWWKPQLQ